MVVEKPIRHVQTLVRNACRTEGDNITFEFRCQPVVDVKMFLRIRLSRAGKEKSGKASAEFVIQ